MKIRLLFTILSLFLLNAAIFAEYYTDNQGVSYYYDFFGDTASVYSGKSASGAVVIPATITLDSRTYSVTSIRYCAFDDCTGLKSIIIPNSVKYIENCAFYDCI